MCDDTPGASTELPRSDLAPSIARHFLHEHRCQAHNPDGEYDAALLTSEVVTNAVRHGGPPVHLRVDCVGDCTFVSVSDASPTEPDRGNGDTDDTHGRGMDIIEAVATDWGVRQRPADGKDVWFTLCPSTC